MAVDLSQQLQRVSIKAQLVIDHYRLVDEQLVQARNEIAELRATVMAQQAKIERLERDYEYLRMFKAVTAGDRLQVRKAKVMIDKLVRDIDRCITDLNE